MTDFHRYLPGGPTAPTHVGPYQQPAPAGPYPGQPQQPAPAGPYPGQPAPAPAPAGPYPGHPVGPQTVPQPHPHNSPDQLMHRPAYAGFDELPVGLDLARKAYQIPGVFFAEVVSIELGITQPRLAGEEGADVFGAELKVLATSSPDVEVGSILHWSTMRSNRFPEYYGKNIKKFLAAVVGQPANLIKKQHMGQAASEAQPLTGRMLQWETYPNPKNGGKLAMRFAPADANSLASFRAQMGAAVGGAPTSAVAAGPPTGATPAAPSPSLDDFPVAF